MTLSKSDIKTLANEIAQQIIAELRNPAPRQLDERTVLQALEQYKKGDNKAFLKLNGGNHG